MNESKEFIKDLKVGDEVILETWGRWESNYTISKVEKVTPTGLVKVNGILFNMNGVPRNNVAATIYDANVIGNILEMNERIEQNKKQRFIREVSQKFREMSLKGITYEEAKQLNDILENIKNRQEG